MAKKWSSTHGGQNQLHVLYVYLSIDSISTDKPETGHGPKLYHWTSPSSSEVQAVTPQKHEETQVWSIKVFWKYIITFRWLNKITELRLK